MTFVSNNCGLTCKIIELFNKLHFLVRALNKSDISPKEEIFGVCKNFIKKLTYDFFPVIDLGTAPFENNSSFTQQKENVPLMKDLFQCILILMSILPIVVEFQNF